MDRHTDSPRRKPRVGAWIALAIVGLTAILLAAWWVLGGGLAQPRTVQDLLAPNGDIHPVEATADLCRDPACVEGWRTDFGTFLRFESEGKAEHWAQVLGNDGRRWRSIVLDMRGVELTFEQRRRAVDILRSADS